MAESPAAADRRRVRARAAERIAGAALALLVAGALAPAAVHAQARQPGSYPTPQEADQWQGAGENLLVIGKESDWADDFMAFVEKKIERAVALDLYGNTAMLPEGVLGIKYTFRYLSAKERFLGDGSRDQLIPTIAFTDDTGEELVGIALNGEGSGTVHLFQISAGITDPIDIFAEMSWSDIRTEFKKPSASFGGALAALGLEDYQDLITVIEALGRPAPNEVFETDGLEFGDIKTGLSWNWYRGPEWSFSNVGAVFIPTGKIAAANNDINFALGPELDRGYGNWAALFVTNADYRPEWLARKLVVSAEVDYRHTFAFDRPTPTTFTEPNPVLAALLDAVGFDSALFPDLTDVPATYGWEPGESIEALIGLSVDLEWVGLGVQYGYSWGGATEIVSSSPEFVQLIEALELTGETESHGLSFQVAPNLLKLGIPLVVGIEYQLPIAGTNAIIFDPALRVVTQMFLPLW